MINRYNQNLEIICAQRNTDLYILADALGIDHTDLRRPDTETLLKISDFLKLSVDVLLRANLKTTEEIKKLNIRMLVTDVDGVLTDNGLYYTESGDEMKKFNAKDGMALKSLAEKGIITGIISHSRNNQIIEKRAHTLKFHWVSVNDEGPKAEILTKKCAELKIGLAQVAYVGDDLNDIEVMKMVGLAVCPADAAKKVKLVAQVVLRAKGGDGCVREFIDSYLD